MCGGHFPLTYVQIKGSQTLWVGSKLWLEGLRLDSGTFSLKEGSLKLVSVKGWRYLGGIVFAEDRLLQMGVLTGTEAQWVGWATGTSCPVRVHFGWEGPPDYGILRMRTLGGGGAS